MIIINPCLNMSTGIFWMIRTTCDIQGLRMIMLATVENIINGFRCIISLKV